MRVSESFVSDRVVGKNRKISLWSGNKNSLGCFHTCAGIALTKQMGGRALGRPPGICVYRVEVETSSRTWRSRVSEAAYCGISRKAWPAPWKYA